MLKWIRGRDPVCKGRGSPIVTSKMYWPMYIFTAVATLGDKCSDLRVESVAGWGVEAAWWRGGGVPARWGRLSRTARGYNWHVFYVIYFLFYEFILNLGFSWQLRRARDTLGLWSLPGAAKAMWVGFCRSSLYVRVMISGGLQCR